MRKWMRERMKRRKKTEGPTENVDSPQQTPLQPAYFDAPAPGTRDEDTASAAEPKEEEPEAEASPAPTVADAADTQEASPGASQRKRRRRGRGGRGRRRPSTATTPAEVAASVPEVAAAAPSEPKASMLASSVPTKGVVVLAIGLPGSGKSSWFKRHNIIPLSSDTLRAWLFDDPNEQRFQDLVFSNLRSMLKARLIARRPMNYVDATNLTPNERHHWIKLAKDYGYEVRAVFFDVPVEVCLERNRRRERAVEEEPMRRMAAKLKAPTFEEGFSKITVVRVKRKDDVAS